jgi:L-lactate dehydrogenase (cytochrome)
MVYWASGRQAQLSERGILMAVIACVDDLRKQMERRVPRMFYDYCESGSWTESTFNANETDLQDIKFRQRVAIDVSQRSTAMTMLGEEVPMPVALAPTGLTGMQHADGEILAAQAAESFGVPFTLSTMSICSIEDVAENTTKPFWFQLYVMRDRKFIRNLVDRAKAANCSALMITLDLQIMGQRHKDVRNGLSAPPKLTLRNMINLATKPSWCLGMLGTRRREFRNIVGHVEGVKDMSSLANWTASQFDPSLSWDDVREIRKQWDGKIIIKGILDVEDARQAVNVGADAVVVSNHGGRQLDGAPSSIAALPAIVDAIGDKCEVWMDGGIRTGQDVLRAVALGAKGTLIGRAFLYGLGAGGRAGVTQVLEILHKELDLTMALCGRSNLSEVDGSILIR